jgi:predicted Holliday junction resolvase-like endonuclease
MSNATIAVIIFIAIIILLLAGIISAIAIRDKKSLQRSGSFASMAAFMEMQTKEKQKAMETIIEQKADKKWEEQESGEGKEEDKK